MPCCYKIDSNALSFPLAWGSWLLAWLGLVSDNGALWNISGLAAAVGGGLLDGGVDLSNPAVEVRHGAGLDG